MGEHSSCSYTHRFQGLLPCSFLAEEISSHKKDLIIDSRVRFSRCKLAIQIGLQYISEMLQISKMLLSLTASRRKLSKVTGILSYLHCFLLSTSLIYSWSFQFFQVHPQFKLKHFLTSNTKNTKMGKPMHRVEEQQSKQNKRQMVPALHYL